MDSRTVVGIGGFPDERLLEYVLGLALDDAAAARVAGRELVEVVAPVPGSRVGPDGEDPLDTRVLE